MGKSTSVAFAFSKAGWIIPTTTATASALSSILVMITIARSGTNRYSSYHFILFFMSFGDVIASIAMALTTIPMPSDVGDFYEFDGMSYGNTGTCEAQGFAIFLGMMLSNSSIMILNLYYVCTIRYGMREEKFKKRILPPTFLLAITVSVTATIGMLLSGNINPRPFDPYCFIGPYPMNCKRDKDSADNKVYECERGGATMNKEAYLALTIPWISLLVAFGFVICSMLLVVATVFNTEMTIRKKRSQEAQERERNDNYNNETDARVSGAGSGSGDSHSHDSNKFKVEYEFEQTRVILRQAIVYISAFLATWLWLWLIVIARGEGSEAFYRIVDPLKVFFQPLQGFFNAGIFLGHKAYSLRVSLSSLDSSDIINNDNNNRNMTFFKALIKAVVSPHEVPGIIISSIHLLDVDMNMSDVEVESEPEPDPDPALSFSDFQSNETPSLNISYALSGSTDILPNPRGGIDRAGGDAKAAPPDGFYQNPINVSNMLTEATNNLPNENGSTNGEGGTSESLKSYRFYPSAISE